jgi:hypothetical protein
MLPEWGGFIWFFVATVLAAMVLGNYVIKDMGGRIDDAFGVSRIYYQWQLRFWYPILHYRNPVS